MAQGQVGNRLSVSMTRREMLGYAQVTALVLLVAAVAFALLQVMVLQPEWIDLGPLDALKRDIPSVRTITRRD